MLSSFYFPKPVNLRAFGHTPLPETHTHPLPVDSYLSFEPQIKPHFLQKALSDFLSFSALLCLPAPSPELWSLLLLSSTCMVYSRCLSLERLTRCPSGWGPCFLWFPRGLCRIGLPELCPGVLLCTSAPWEWEAAGGTGEPWACWSSRGPARRHRIPEVDSMAPHLLWGVMSIIK